MSRKCSICNHDRRQEIERTLLRGESNRAVAQQFAVSRGAVASHLKHVSAALSQARKVREIEDGKTCFLSHAERVTDDRWEIALPPHRLEALAV